MNREEREALPVFRVVMNRPASTAAARPAAPAPAEPAPVRESASGPAAPRREDSAQAGRSGEQWTPAQQAAIHTEGGSLYVSAAAGSGKTAVLTRRIIEKIKRGGDVRRLLVVTFTVSAAAEMRSRIRDGLQKELAANPGSRHLQAQSILTGRAKICTIDSFCADLVRSNFHALGLSPDFRIADGAEEELLRRAALTEVFEQFYAEEDADFLEGVAQFSTQKNDEGYFQTVLSVLDWLDSLPYPLEQFSRFMEQWNPASGGGLYSSPWFAEAAGHARRVLSRALRCYERIEAALQDDQSLQAAWGDVFAAEKAALSALVAHMDAQDWEGFTAGLKRGVFGSLAGRRVKAESSETLVRKAWIQELRDQCRKDVRRLHPGVYWGTQADFSQDLERFYPVLRGLMRVLKAFYARDWELKRARNTLTFSDITHCALRLLVDGYDWDSGELRRTALARELAQELDEIYIDEFQDTNLSQNLLFEAVSRVGENLFCVGDVKQSIYRFRRAMPELFMQKLAGARAVGEGFPAAVHLSQNFRSAEGVLTFANSFFERLMRADACGLDYDADQRLYPGAPYPDGDYDPELHLIELYGSAGDADGGDGGQDGAAPDGDERKAGAQARLCARRIREMMEEGRMVSDRSAGGRRPMRYSDIAILMRSAKDRARIYIQALQQEGIPCWSETAASYFENYEVLFTLAFLEAIDNPWSDLSLTAALRSPFFGFTAAQLAALREGARRESVYDSLTRAAAAGDEQAAAAVRTIAHYRELAMNQPVYRLIWQIYMDFSLFAVVAGMEQGERRQENLRQIYRYARQYENSSLKGLYGFLRYMERAREQTERMEAVSPAPAGDYVRICTIHKSKGLEYPVVFLCGSDVRFNMSDLNGKLLLHDRLGLGSRLRDLDKKVEYTTLARDAVELALRRETIAEELRVLYVAMTRAREKLIVTACIREDKPGASLRRIGLQQLAPDPYMELTQAGSALDWILGAALRHAASIPLRAEYGIPESGGEYDAYPLRFQRWDEASLAALPAVQPQPAPAPEPSETPSALAAASSPADAPSGQDAASGTDASPGAAHELSEILRRLAYEYPYAGLARVPAKVSVSDLKGLRMQDEDGKPLYDKAYLATRPAFTAGQGTELTPQEAGTALHKFMQFFDYGGPAPERQLAQMQARGIIGEREAAAVDLARVRRFLQSPLAARIRQSPRTYSEYRFTSDLPAQQYRPDLAGPAADARVLLQGVVDLFFEEGDGLVVVDYKTDRNSDPAYFQQKYKLQMDLYAAAVSRIAGKPVRERIVYAFHLNQEISL